MSGWLFALHHSTDVREDRKMVEPRGTRTEDGLHDRLLVRFLQCHMINTGCYMSIRIVYLVSKNFERMHKTFSIDKKN